MKVRGMKTTHLLIVLNLLIYAARVGVTGGAEFRNFSTGTLLEFGALDVQLVRQGEAFRLVTAMFMHLTPLHLAMNMLALWQGGAGLEPRYGRGRFVALYVVAGLAGWAATLAWHWREVFLSAGASGAISGLIGAGVVAGHLAGGAEGVKLRDSMIRWAITVLVFGLAVGADNAAHAGGFVAGCAIAWLLDRGGARAAPRVSSAGVGLESIFLIGLVGGGFGLAGRAHQRDTAIEEAVRRGVEHGTAGRVEQAAAEYRKALALDPKNVVAHFDLGLSLLRLKDYPGAIAEARAAIALD